MGSDRVRYGLTPWQAVANAERERDEARAALAEAERRCVRLGRGERAALIEVHNQRARAERAEARVEELEAALEDDASA